MSAENWFSMYIDLWLSGAVRQSVSLPPDFSFETLSTNPNTASSLLGSG